MLVPPVLTRDVAGRRRMDPLPLLPASLGTRRGSSAFSPPSLPSPLNLSLPAGVKTPSVLRPSRAPMLRLPALPLPSPLPASLFVFGGDGRPWRKPPVTPERRPTALMVGRSAVPSLSLESLASRLPLRSRIGLDDDVDRSS